MNCPATGGLATFGKPEHHWKEPASPPIAVLSRQYPIRKPYVNFGMAVVQGWKSSPRRVMEKLIESCISGRVYFGSVYFGVARLVS